MWTSQSKLTSPIFLTEKSKYVQLSFSLYKNLQLTLQYYHSLVLQNKHIMFPTWYMWSTSQLLVPINIPPPWFSFIIIVKGADSIQNDFFTSFSNFYSIGSQSHVPLTHWNATTILTKSFWSAFYCSLVSYVCSDTILPWSSSLLYCLQSFWS